MFEKVFSNPLLNAFVAGATLTGCLMLVIVAALAAEIKDRKRKW
jgi:hypothetical protein